MQASFFSPVKRNVKGLKNRNTFSPSSIINLVPVVNEEKMMISLIIITESSELIALPFYNTHLIKARLGLDNNIHRNVFVCLHCVFPTML